MSSRRRAKKKGVGRGRGRGSRGRGKVGRGRGWHDPEASEAELSDEDAPQDDALPRALTVPSKLLEVLGQRMFAATDAAKRMSLAVLLSARSSTSKLHTALMVDHISGAQSATLTTGGRSAVARFLLDHAELQIMGLVISLQTQAAVPTIAAVRELRVVEQLAGRPDVFLCVMWRQGAEPRPGLQFYSQRTDRPGVEPDENRHEALDFLVPRHTAESQYRISLAILGAALADTKGSQHRGAAEKTSSALLDQTRPSLQLARAADVWGFLQKGSIEKGTKVLPVSSWLERAPVAAGLRTLKDGQNQIREALEALARNQRLRVRKGRGDRWDPTAWVVELP